MAIEDKILNFNILVIDDDLLVLPSLKSIYEFLIEIGEFTKILGDQAIGSVTTAPDTKAAERILLENFEKDPKILQILHVDERIPDERGSEFVDRIRRKNTESNIGALLVTGYSTDVSVLNSRASGVYRYLSKPINPPKLIPNLIDLIEMILLKDRPVKKEVEGVYVFRPITDEEEVKVYLHKRYEVWRKLNYIPDEFLSERSKMEIDDYDKVSIPLGGFRLDKNNELAILARLITPHLQENCIRIFKQILDKQDDEILSKAFNKSISHPFTLLRDCNNSGQIFTFINKYGGIDNTVEFSRIMDTSNSYRGQNLSTCMAQFHDMYAKYQLKARVGIASCLVKHVGHNCNRNAFTGVIPDTQNFDASRVEQIAQAIYVDLNDISNQAPDFHEHTIRGMYEMFKKKRYFCYCKRKDCLQNRFLLQDSWECEKNRLGRNSKCKI
jgi:CheY-like chemotaxis protein